MSLFVPNLFALWTFCAVYTNKVLALRLPMLAENDTNVNIRIPL